MEASTAIPRSRDAKGESCRFSTTVDTASLMAMPTANKERPVSLCNVKIDHPNSLERRNACRLGGGCM